MENLFKTYLIETIEKRVKYINMHEEDKGTGMWEDLIKFFVMAGETSAQRKGDVLEIAIKPESGEFDWIELYRRGDRVMIKADSINKLFGFEAIKGVNEIYFTKGGITTRKGWYFELEFEYLGKPYILRFMSEGFNLNKDRIDKLTVAVKYLLGPYAILTTPIPVNNVNKRNENSIEKHEARLG